MDSPFTLLTGFESLLLPTSRHKIIKKAKGVKGWKIGPEGLNIDISEEKWLEREL